MAATPNPVWVDEGTPDKDEAPELVVRFDPDWQIFRLRLEGANTWLRLSIGDDLAQGALASLPRTESS